MKGKIVRGFKKMRWGLNDGLFAAGIKRINPYKTGRVILIYHGITKHARTDINSRFISTELFEKQIRYISTNFNVVTLSEYFKGVNIPNKITCALTFDDGYLNNLTEAIPILEKYHVPATFFITTIGGAEYNVLWADMLDLHRLTGPDTFTFNNTIFYKGRYEYVQNKISLKYLLKNSGWQLKKELVDIILSKNNFLNDWQYFPYFKLLDQHQIVSLSNSKYAEIGSHGLYHNCLDKLPLPEVNFELVNSKAWLENIIQKEVTSIAYPNGSYTAEIIDLAEKTGYKTQLAVDYLFSKDELDPRIEKRFGINPYISFNNQIQCILDGKY